MKEIVAAQHKKPGDSASAREEMQLEKLATAIVCGKVFFVLNHNGLYCCCSELDKDTPL